VLDRGRLLLVVGVEVAVPDLATYLQRLQRVLGDTTFQRFNIDDLIQYINEARVFVALEGECCRGLVPSTAGLSNITLTAGGVGYTSAPTVLVQAPQQGTQATAQAFVSGGAVTYVQLISPGSGYSTFNMPGISFSGGGGSGAAATANLMPFCQAIVGQEVYQHQALNPILKGSPVSPGLDEIISIRTCSVSWGSMKPTMRYMVWSDFQAYLRSYNVAAQGFPRVWSPYAPGNTGSFYLWPIPAQNAQMDLDVTATPVFLDIGNDQIIDAIPRPFDLAVPYKAAEIAVIPEPDLAPKAQLFAAQYDMRMRFASAMAYGRTVVPDPYNSAAMA
jgi:hypothetical protein